MGSIISTSQPANNKHSVSLAIDGSVFFSPLFALRFQWPIAPFRWLAVMTPNGTLVWRTMPFMDEPI